MRGNFGTQRAQYFRSARVVKDATAIKEPINTFLSQLEKEDFELGSVHIVYLMFYLKCESIYHTVALLPEEATSTHG